MRKIVFMGMPHHGNIGDQAIALAEEELIKKYFPDFETIEFPEKTLLQSVLEKKDIINDDDILLMHGGGNIGDTYDVPEKGRRAIIEMFPNNKIIVFPQTSHFDSIDELNESKRIYNGHKDLTIMAREEKSYEFMKNNFDKCKVYLTPDIVMTMREHFDYERNNVLLMFRSDKEKTLSSNAQERIINIVNNMYGNYIKSDMHLGEDVTNIDGDLREKTVREKFKQLNTCKLVITDRLHGMIFSAVTETPCVVFGSYTHKIKESYKWLKNLGYIDFCDDVNMLEEKILKVSACKDRHYDNSFAVEKIAEILKNEIK
ncbi:MAG: polysaccharide pyruvyl transferase family protein [Clostridia bacterium]|nr:polysaccharide pyruvyl transferase family protein [Clostridia bacterium]